MKAVLTLAFCLLLAAGATHGAPCTVDDYSVVYSDCDVGMGTRTAAYYWTPPRTCSGGVDLPDFEEVTCDCTAYDYVATVGPCNEASGTRTKTYTKDSDCSGGIAAPDDEDLACICDADDAEGTYTPCDPSTNTRSVVYFWPVNATCVTDGAVLPATARGLPCDIVCGEGTYLPLGATECAECGPGSYSLGGAVVHNKWDFWPFDFETSCEGDDCQPWQLHGSHIDSGDNYGKHDVRSELTLSLKTEKVGYLRFTYKVDSEFCCDGLAVYVDGAKVLPSAANTKHMATVLQWTPYVFPLHPGFHTVQFVYEKDYSVSRGTDKAEIQLIEVVGTVLAMDSCAPCAPGTATSAMGSIECTPCAVNTFQADHGQAFCNNCSATTYAFPGARLCDPREPCNEHDYTEIYGACDGDNAPVSYDFTEPSVCNVTAYDLPADTMAPCEECFPGETRDDATGACDLCPAGYVSDGVSACSPCAAGTAALPVLHIDYFDQWIEGMTSTCVGECPSPGWRLRHDFIDTGLGGPGEADIDLTFTVDLVTDGEVSITFSVDCDGLNIASNHPEECYLEFLVDDVNVNEQRGSLQETTMTMPIPAGTHVLTANFHRDDPTGTHWRAHAAISNFVVLGDGRGGGAAPCSACPPGTKSGDLAATCEPCPPGTSSDGGSDVCTPCPAGTFSDVTGGLCFPCGHGTTSEEGATECDVTCTYAVDSHNTYDLSALARDDEMWGPVPFDAEPNVHKYFVNICSKDHSNHSCYDEDGHAIPAYACQITLRGYSVSLGDVIGFHELADGGPDDGVIVEFTRGTEGCAEPGRPARPRTMNITMLCNPFAGVGLPTKPASGRTEYPTHSCRYNLVWESLYACPLCTEDDYTFVLGDCEGAVGGEGGTRTKVYRWLDDIPRCHGGVQLPPDEVIPCAGSIVCDPGYYEFNETTCAPCGPGTFSLGGGRRVFLGNALADGSLKVLCGDSSDDLGPCPAALHWDVVTNSTIATAANSPHRVVQARYTVNLDKPGEISFRYTVNVANPSAGFSFGADAWTYASNVELTAGERTYKRTLGAGTHVLVWTMDYGNSDKVPAYVGRLMVGGEFGSALTCSLCGVHGDSHYSDGEANTECKECPPNTRRTLHPAASCEPCPEGTYRLAGQSHCNPRPLCGEEDYVHEASPCVAGFKTVSTILAEPAICAGGEPPAEDGQAACQACQPAFELRDGACAPCPPGSASPDGVACTPCASGSIAIPALVMDRFDDPARGRETHGMTSWCTGACGSDGWRESGEYMESGSGAFGPYHSYLAFDFDLADTHTPSFAFKYFIDDEAEGDLLLFVDAAPQGLMEIVASGRSLDETSLGGIRLRHHAVDVNLFEDFVIALEPGVHNVLFVYTQQTPTESKAYVRDVVIEGITNVDAAGAVACTTCPTGMYANAADATCEEAQLGFYVPPSDAGLTAPLPCPVNTFADHTGSGACTPCGAGTTTSGQTGRSECDDPCRLVLADGDVFSLARLSTNGLMYTIPVPASVSGAGDQEWHLEMCVASGDSSHCRNPDGSQMHTRACMEVDGEVFDAGRAVAYYPLPAPSVGVKVQLFHGGSCPTGGELMTEIDVHCDIEGGIGSPVPATPFQTGCLHKFSWRSGYGCPACLESDFEEVVGECKGGVQITSWTKKRDCLGELPDDSSGPCSSVEVSWVYIVVAGGVLVLAVCGCLMCFCRARKTEYKYSNLLEQTGHSTAMGAFALDSESESDNDVDGGSFVSRRREDDDGDRSAGGDGDDGGERVAMPSTANDDGGLIVPALAGPGASDDA